MTTDLDIPARPRLKREWEILDLKDGSVLFHSIYGRQLRLRSPPTALRGVLDRMDGQLSVDELLASSGPADGVDPGRLLRSVADLARAGVIEQGRPAAARPAWLTAEMLDRFSTELDYLSRFATPEADELEYFRRLQRSHVCIIGAGGNGNFCAMKLAATGVGRLTIVDGDVVEPSNLVRQIFFDEGDVGRPKVEALSERIRAFTRFTTVEPIRAFIDGEEDAARVIAGADFVVLCADAPRFLINRWVNRACLEAGVPYINSFAGVIGPLCVPRRSPCFECFERFLRAKLGDVHDMIVDAMQVRRTRQYPSFIAGPVTTSVLKVKECVGYLTGAWAPRSLDRILLLDYLGATTFEVIPKDPECSECGDDPRRAHDGMA